MESMNVVEEDAYGHRANRWPYVTAAGKLRVVKVSRISAPSMRLSNVQPPVISGVIDPSIALDKSLCFKERLFMSVPNKDANNHMQRAHPML